MWRVITGGAVLAVLAMLVAGRGLAEDKPEVKPKDETKKKSEEAAEAKAYWLGLQVAKIPEQVREHRKLPKEEGILVTEVLPEGPAAKAGLKPQDVIVKAGKKAIKEPADLVSAVQATKRRPLTVEVLRDGNSQSFTLTPSPRPRRFAEVRPGLALPPGAPASPERAWRRFLGPEPTLPDDVTVTITKSGKKPAQILVKQGDQKWEASEEELNKLPDQARPYVARMLGRPPWGLARLLLAPPEGGTWRAPPILPDQGQPFWMTPPADKRLDEMNQRIDKLQSMVEALQKNQAQGKGKPEETKK